MAKDFSTPMPPPPPIFPPADKKDRQCRSLQEAKRRKNKQVFPALATPLLIKQKIVVKALPEFFFPFFFFLN